MFLSPTADTTPLALRANVTHNRALHAHVIILSVETTTTPHVPEDQRLTVDDLGYRDDGIWHLSACFGFHDTRDVPEALRLARRKGLGEGLEVDRASYFVSRVKVTPTGTSGMSRWRKKLFGLVARNAVEAADYFCLPRDRTVAIGGHVEL